MNLNRSSNNTPEQCMIFHLVRRTGSAWCLFASSIKECTGHWWKC